MRANNFFVCGPKFPQFLNPSGMGCSWSHAIHIFVISIYSGVICAQIRQLSEISQKFGRFLPSQNLLGHPFQNLYTDYHACFAARRLVKFCQVTPTNRDVIGTHMLNFKANFLHSPLKFLGEASPRFGWALANLGQSLSRIKILRGQHPPKFCIWKKVHLGKPTCAPITFLPVDRSSPYIFRQ